MTAQTEQIPEPDFSGSTFERYHLIRRLGVGGMGAVYEAEHTQLHKHCAVKMLRQELARNELFRRRFLREARAASAVAHPHVVDISDFGETPDGQVFFVMELLKGRELQDVLEVEGRLSWPRTRAILLQVTSALGAAHREGVIHRDVKPSNCFLVDLPGQEDEDFVKVLDFGIAKVSSNLDKSTAQLTSTQEIFGTIAYMAPEMAMGTSDDPRSDIYALGVMMYRMLVGELPFAEGNAFQILSQHVSEPPPLPRSKEPSIPEEVEAIILKALAKKPDERFASMEKFGQALRHGSIEAGAVAAGAGAVGLQTTMVGLRSEGLSGTGVLSVGKTTPLPARGVMVDRPRVGSGSGPMAVRAANSGSMSIGEEPTMLPTPVASSSSPSLTAPRIEPTVALETSPQRIEQTLPSSSEPTPQRRSPWWLALPVVGLVAAGGLVAAVLVPGGDDEPAVQVPRAGEPVVPEPRPVVIAVEPKPPPVLEPPRSPHTDEPAEVVVSDVVDASEPAVVEPEPESVPKAKPKAKHATKPKTDQGVVRALKARILATCELDGSTTVKVEGLISASGRLGSPLITPSTGLGACVKKVVSSAKFDPAGGVRPMPRFSVEL